MGMEIKIDAVNMLKILVNAGLDATDAKAIIFDLLQYPDGNFPIRQQLKEAKKQRKKIVVEDDDDEEEEDEEEEDEEEERVDPLATRIKKPKRINFKGFGGPAPAIIPQK
jgi:Ran GTPase-activating protein (RanGAP) involved in mRNA processing and transport